MRYAAIPHFCLIQLIFFADWFHPAIFVFFHRNITLLTLSAAILCFLGPSLEVFLCHIAQFHTLVQSLVGASVLLERRVAGDFFLCLTVGTDFIAGLFFSRHDEIAVHSIRAAHGNKQHPTVLTAFELHTPYQCFHQLIAEHIIDIIQNRELLNKLSDERYARMIADYEKEQKELLAAVESDEQTVRDMEQERIDLHQFLNAMRECTDLKELTPTLVNTLIKRIEVHNSSVDENGVKHVPVDIHFTAVGIINIPDTGEILQIMEEIRTKPLRIA